VVRSQEQLLVCFDSQFDDFAPLEDGDQASRIAYPCQRAAAAAAEEDREVVVDEFAAAVGENGWPIDQTRPPLLGAAGLAPSDARLFGSMLRRIAARKLPMR